jgi:hypothetical protein
MSRMKDRDIAQWSNTLQIKGKLFHFLTIYARFD